MKQINKIILIIIGFLLFSAYIWLRFLRERLPRDIPFTLSIPGFFILLYICIIYCYILYFLIFEKKYSNAFINNLITYIYEPLKTLDESIKNNFYVERYYKRFIIYLANKLDPILINNYIYYYVFWIFPRIILISALLIDTFYFHYLYYIYKVLLIGILLLINRYIIYSLKYAKEHFIINLAPLLNDGKVTVKYDHEFWIDYIEKNNLEEEDKDEDEDEDEIPPTMRIPLKDFIEFQSESIFYYYSKKRYSAIYNEKCNELYHKKHNISYNKNQKLSEDIMTKIFTEIDQKIENITKISLLILYYYLYNDYTDKIKRIKIIIFSLYFLCWGHILIVSMYTLPLDFISLLLNLMLGSLLIITLSINYLYYYYISNININYIEKGEYQIGILRIKESISIKMVVGRKENRLIIIGYLNDKRIEENKNNNKMSLTLDTEEELYFNSISNPWIIKPTDFKINKTLTKTIQDSDLINKLNKLTLIKDRFYQYKPIENTIENVNEAIRVIKYLERRREETEIIIKEYQDTNVDNMTHEEFIEYRDSLKLIEESKQEEFNEHKEIRWLLEMFVKNNNINKDDVNKD